MWTNGKYRKVRKYSKQTGTNIYAAPVRGVNNSKKAYQLVKYMITEKQGKSTTMQDKSEKYLTEEHEILDIWTE